MTKPKHASAKRANFDGLAWPPVLPKAIQVFSKDLLQQLDAIERGRAGRRGARGRDGAHFKPATIRLLVASMLATCGRRRQAPPMALVDVVIRLLAKVSTQQLQDALDDAMGWSRYTEPMMLALNYEIANPGASQRSVAAAAGVDHKTVAKWRQTPHYRLSLPHSIWSKFPAQSGE